MCLLTFDTGTASGQTTGKISGRITDPSGTPLPGVTVEITSPSLQGTRSGVTDPDGLFRFPAIPPGNYRVQASLSGFWPASMTLTVTLDASVAADLTLRLETSEEVIVSGEAPSIDRSSTTTGTNYTSDVIDHLPVARNYADIVKSNPGVSTDRGVTEGRSLALSIYGATSAENQWIIDGVNTTNVFKGVQGKAINNEFVQEVEVKTGGYQAEYGRALGGVVNVITKSGGNEFHGDAFAYYDSTGTSAEKQFKSGDSGIAEMRVADGERFDYGFDLGGFLLKDRLWLFGAYNRVGLQGDLSRVQASTHVPADAKFPFDSAENLYSGKLTWNAATSTTAVGTIFADPSTTSGAAGADPRQGLGFGDVAPPVSLEPSTWYSSRSQGGTDFGLRLTQLFGSNVIADTSRLLPQGSKRPRLPLIEIRYVDQTCVGGMPGSPCAFPPEPNSVTGGYGAVGGPADHSVSSRRQYAGGATLYSGNHEIKAGGDYVDGRTSATSFATGEQLVWIRNEQGQTYYVHRYFAVSPNDPTVVPTFQASARVLDYGLYVQDSWRVAQGLTVDVGLRWDGERTHDYTGRTVLRFSNEWQPRVGVAWDPWQDGKTKLYAFAGRFSYALPTVAAALSFNDLTTLQTYNFDPVSLAQDPNVVGHRNTVVLTDGRQDQVDAGVRASSQDELTLGIERILMPSLIVGIKGTYRSLNRTIEDRCDFDYAETGFGCALINPGSSGQFASGDAPTCNGLWDDPEWYRCDPTSGPATPEVRRIYRGVEVMARETVGNSLWLQASYVYSSLRGNYDGGVNQGAEGLTWPGVNMDFDYPALWHDAYGTLGLDRPHRFRLDGYYVTPWRLSVGLQVFVESGAPLNQMGFFNSGYGAVVFLVPRGSAGRLPTLWGTNLQLSYPIVVGPTIVTLQAYLFNVFNQQIAISRDNSWSISPPEGFPGHDLRPQPGADEPRVQQGHRTARTRGSSGRR